MPKRLPAFGRNLVDKRPEDYSRTIRLYVGAGAIEKAAPWVRKDGFPWLALPAGEEPERFDWNGVAGWEILVIDRNKFSGLPPTDPALLHRLCVKLMEAGAIKVFDVTRGSRGVIYRQESEREAA